MCVRVSVCMNALMCASVKRFAEHVGIVEGSWSRPGTFGFMDGLQYDRIYFLSCERGLNASLLLGVECPLKLLSSQLGIT